MVTSLLVNAVILAAERRPEGLILANRGDRSRVLGWIG